MSCVLFRYVLIANANDLGSPQRTSNNYTIVINVLRNLYAPHFLNAPYTFRISRSTAVNSNIGQVFARDSDTVSPFNVITLEATGDNSAPGYFGVRSNGAIYIRNSLTGASEREYL